MPFKFATWFNAANITGKYTERGVKKRFPFAAYTLKQKDFEDLTTRKYKHFPDKYIYQLFGMFAKLSAPVDRGINSKDLNFRDSKVAKREIAENARDCG